MKPNIVPLVDKGLGNSSYIVDLGDGRAIVIDPSRDPSQYLAAARQHGLAVAFAAETHLHADFVSGSKELSALGTRILAPAAGGIAFDHHGIVDGEEVDLGGLTLRALATPGHTPEHLSYLLLDGSDPVALFSGGSLLVGSVARTDLITPEQTEELARSLWRSIRGRLLTLPDDLVVYPTHGAGSFCATPATGERTTTIGAEKAHNPLLSAANEDEFLATLLGGLGSYPTYFRYLREINRRGPAIIGVDTPALAPLHAGEVASMVQHHAVIVDARPVEAFAKAHISGSISIELRASFASWLGWLVEPNQEIVFVLGPSQDRAQLVREALKIGYENLAGELSGGVPAWQDAGYKTESFRLVRAAEMTDPIIDVRQSAEFMAGHIPQTTNIELGSLARAGNLGSDAVTVMCEHGQRAITGASLLARNGMKELSVAVGGPEEWALANHRSLETG